MNIRISSWRMSAAIHFFHFLSRFHDSSTGSSHADRLWSREASVDDRGREIDWLAFGISQPLSRVKRERARVVVNFHVFLPDSRLALHVRGCVSHCIASHCRCITRVWPRIPRRAREQKGWNAPALSFLSPCVARILINGGGETLRHSAAARAAEMNLTGCTIARYANRANGQPDFTLLLAPNYPSDRKNVTIFV